MSLSQATRWQNRIGRMGALFCALFIFAGMDGLIANFRQPINQFDLQPGESASVNGGLPMDVKDPGELTFESDSPDIRIAFEALHAGFWLGGNMWRGALEVQPSTPAGRYSATVLIKDRPSEKPLATFVVQVHETQESIRQSSKSIIRRNLDLAPWILFGVFFLLAVVAFGGVYLLTEMRDRLLAEEGKAELYRIAKRDGCFEVAFGLGKKHGIEPGEALPLVAKNGETIGTVRVQDVFDEDSTGEVDLECKVKPGCFVTKPGFQRIWTG
jgi:hypothetical protein